MILHEDGGRWYADVRPTTTSEQLSYDLTHHLPRRIAAGTVIVVADNTRVFLSVIKKRWAKLLHEVECQRSSTMERLRKESLQYEADQMRNCRFATKPPGLMPGAHVYFLTPDQLDQAMPDYATLFITTPVPPAVLRPVTATLVTGGVIVTYGSWPDEYDFLLECRPVMGRPRERP